MPQDFIILRNAARCEICHTTVESTHRHDFSQCKCGNVFVDGGLVYLRGGAQHWASFTDLTEVISTAESRPL